MIYDVIMSLCFIVMLIYDILQLKENKHLRKLIEQMNNSTDLLIQQNKELWELSKVVGKDGDTP